ncbi:MAG: ABC transporter ATP-binding protein [Pseudomonadota bacterium]
MFAWFENLLDPYQRYDDSGPPPRELAGFFREMLTPARGMLAASLALVCVAAAADALMIYFAGDLIDRMRSATPETFWRDHGDAVLLMVLVVAVIRPAAAIGHRLLLGNGFVPAMGALLRWRGHRHMLRQSTGFFAEDFAGRIANKQIQIAPAFNDIVYQTLDALAYSIVFFGLATALFASIDAWLLAPLAFWFALYVGAAVYFVPRIAKAGWEVAEARSRLSGRIVDSYTNIQTVKLFAHAQREERYARDSIEDLRRHVQDMTRVHSRLTIVMMSLDVVLILGVIGAATLLWMTGATGVGVVAAAAALVMRLQALTDWIMWTLSSLFENIGTVKEGVDTIAQPLRLTDAPAAPALQVRQAGVRFESVAHRYGRGPEFSGKGVGVDGVELAIAPGERVGLVGRSGAGKSTLVNLLLRFFDPETGRVLIDGQDIRQVRQESLRAAIGMVTQDNALLHRSILENIAYGWPETARESARPEAMRAAVAEAARRVAAHDFIEELSDKDGRHGYDAMVGERGVKLSGGQRQRIALARVVLKDAPILVLDEATSALDSEVEAAILEAMETLMQGKTVIAIAHRLSTIAQMDRIVVMDRGRIVEQGPHSELLASGGLYARLWARQSGGFLPESVAGEDPGDGRGADPAMAASGSGASR